MIATLKLDNNHSLYARFPDAPEFAEDEVEIWLKSSNDEICLFKDSLHYVLMMESSWAVHHLNVSSETTNICFPRLYVDHCLGKIANDSYLDHLFTEYHHNTMWLTKKNRNQIALEIWEIAPFSNPPLCELRYFFSVSSEEFMKWWNQLIAKERPLQ